MGLFNLLDIELLCPKCNVLVKTGAEFKIGYKNQFEYKLGDKIEWFKKHQGRPPGGNYDGEGYVECPNCKFEFLIDIHIKDDTICDFEINLDKHPHYPTRANSVVKKNDT
jgi:uncharacterized C2H2 Zn-finger protein